MTASHRLPTCRWALLICISLRSPLQGKIATALQHGVVKMNVDTDTQWAYWSGLLEFYKAKEGYLQGQIGNPDGPEKPNKKFYDPRVWIRKCEESMIKRIVETFEDLNCKGKLA